MFKSNQHSLSESEVTPATGTESDASPNPDNMLNVSNL